MNTRHKLFAAGAVSVIALTGVAGLASAATDTSTGTTLVDKIAAKFHINKSEVQAVFDQDKTDRQASMEASYEARLTQAVKDGKLTEDQKSKLLTKHKELQAQMEKQRSADQTDRQSMESKTDAERQALMDARRKTMDEQKAAIEAWEKANNIPTGYLFGGPGGPGHGHGGMGMSMDR